MRPRTITERYQRYCHLIERLSIRKKATEIVIVLLFLKELIEGRRQSYYFEEIDCGIISVEEHILYQISPEARAVDIGEVGLRLY